MGLVHAIEQLLHPASADEETPAGASSPEGPPADTTPTAGGSGGAQATGEVARQAAEAEQAKREHDAEVAAAEAREAGLNQKIDDLTGEVSELLAAATQPEPPPPPVVTPVNPGGSRVLEGAPGPGGVQGYTEHTAGGGSVHVGPAVHYAATQGGTTRKPLT